MWKKQIMGDFSSIVCILVCMTSMVQVQSIYPDGHLSIVNNFTSPTDITCYSYINSRPLYTSQWREVYQFTFHIADDYRFWDCQIYNRAWGVLGVFRFYGDSIHRGSQLSNCHDCIWSVDQGGVSIFVDDAWQFKYRWPRNQVQQQLGSTPPLPSD